MNADEIRTNALSERIIGCAFRVLNTLGAGFLEKVYENALAHELRRLPDEPRLRVRGVNREVLGHPLKEQVAPQRAQPRTQCRQHAQFGVLAWAMEV